MGSKKFYLTMGAVLFAQALSFSSFAMDINDKDGQAPVSPRRAAIVKHMHALQQEIQRQNPEGNKPLEKILAGLSDALSVLGVPQLTRTDSVKEKIQALPAAGAAPEDISVLQENKGAPTAVKSVLPEILWGGNFHNHLSHFENVTNASLFLHTAGRADGSIALIVMLDNALKAGKGYFRKLESIDLHFVLPQTQYKLAYIFSGLVSSYKQELPSLIRITIRDHFEGKAWTGTDKKHFLELCQRLRITVNIEEASAEEKEWCTRLRRYKIQSYGEELSCGAYFKAEEKSEMLKQGDPYALKRRYKLP